LLFACASFNKGIIGTVACAVSRSSRLLEGQAIIDAESDVAGCLHGSATIVSSPLIQEITEMINSAYSRCKPTGGATGKGGVGLSASTLTASSSSVTFSDGSSSMEFLLEELCHAVRGGKLAKPVLDYIDELVRSDFEDIFVGEFVDNDDDDDAQHRGTKGDMHTLEMVPKDSADLGLLDGSSGNTIAPPGELRFGEENDVYVKILPLLSSNNPTLREFWPVQISPMFRLIACLSDVEGLLGCPILLPSATSSGMEFEDLGTTKQWVVTASYYFATCWVRELINSFIHAADESGSFPGLPMGSFTSSSQGFDCIEVQKKIVARLKGLVELEEELRFTSSKCYTFAPPGKSQFELLFPFSVENVNQSLTCTGHTCKYYRS
jgi:hypothetical protein